jgi:hypothetical protein
MPMNFQRGRQMSDCGRLKTVSQFSLVQLFESLKAKKSLSRQSCNTFFLPNAGILLVTTMMVSGHEVFGRVFALGPDTKESGLQVGDYVMVYPWIGCLKCDRCDAGKCNLCECMNVILCRFLILSFSCSSFAFVNLTQESLAIDKSFFYLLVSRLLSRACSTVVVVFGG